MEFIKSIVEWMNMEMDEPSVFGSFHLFCILAIVFFCILLFRYLRDASDRSFRIAIGVMALIMIFGEGLKQTLFQMTLTDGNLAFEYSWADFPFQLCSTPLYVLPWLSILPDGRMRDVAAAYTMTFGLIGGLAVYINPKSVFSVHIFANIHTMIHHGLQILSGAYAIFYYRRRINGRTFFEALSLFAFMFVIANLLNTVGYDILVANGLIEVGDTFNMFYTSPRADQTVPVCSELLKGFHPLVYIGGYFIVLSLIGLYILRFSGLIYRNSRKRMMHRMDKR